MPEFPPKTEAESVAELTRRALEPHLVSLTRGDAGQAAVLLVPSGYSPHDTKKYLDAYLPAPERRQGTARFVDLASLCAHVTRFADRDSVVFADPTPAAPSLTAVLDYHRGGSDGAPRWGQHRATYAFPLDDAWKFWSAPVTGLSQGDLAARLEDRLGDLADPAGADDLALELVGALGCRLAGPGTILDLARGLEVHVHAKVSKQVNLASGEGQLTYTEDHTDGTGAPLKIPGAFLVAVPVFKGGPVYQLAIRLRYRVKDGQVTWALAPHRPERALAHALDAAFAHVRHATQLPVLLGTPEG